MQVPLASVTLICVIGLAASQSFSFSFGLDDASSGVIETPFNFQKLKSQSPSATELSNNARSTARGASRMASGSSRGRIQDTIPQAAVTTRAFTTSAPPAIRIATRDLFTPKVTTQAPVLTRNPFSSSVRKSTPTTVDKKLKVSDQPISSFSFSGLTEETEIERLPQNIVRNTVRISSQTEVRNAERTPQSSLVEKANHTVNQNKERNPQRTSTNTGRIPPSTGPISERVATSPIVTASRAPLSVKNITKPVLQSVIQPIQSIPHSSIRNVDRAPQDVKANQPETAKENEQVNEIEIGRSPCARGIQGHDCRMHLLQTALACTSGPCHQCQQCGSITPDQWVSCCRDHFLCCRSLARSCQKCDHPTLLPFCKVSFGKCK